MSLDTTVRQRYGGSKVRTGCITCKIRHVKCDEFKPFCNRCTKTGRRCDGYASPKEDAARPLVIINYVAQPSKVLSLLPFQDSKEQRGLVFFQARTAPELAGSFATDMWSKFVMQAIHHEPAIRHAAIALGTFHEHLETIPNSYVASSEFGMLQYSKAIQHLLRSDPATTKQSIDTTLISCILFTSIESIQGNIRSALTHVHNGLKVLAERESLQQSAADASYFPRSILNAIFLQLESQALEIGDQVRPTEGCFGSLLDLEISLLDTIGTLEEAQDTLDRYINCSMRFAQSVEWITKDGSLVPPETLQQLSELHAQLFGYFHNWCVAFDKFLVLELSPPSSVGRTLHAQPRPGILVLQIWRIVLNILARIDCTQGEMSYDQFLPDFESVVSLCQTFLNQTASRPTRSTKAPPVQACGEDSKIRPRICLSPDSSTQVCSRARAMSYAHSFVVKELASIRPEEFACLYISDMSSPHSSSHGDLLPSMQVPTNDAPADQQRLCKPTFSLSLGILTPLYMVSTRCRDPVVRRKGIHLLANCNRKEGIWDSYVASRVANRILEIEEAGALPYFGTSTTNISSPSARTSDVFFSSLDDASAPVEDCVVIDASQIPEEARVREMDTFFGPERQLRFRYRMGTSHPTPKRGAEYEEVLVW